MPFHLHICFVATSFSGNKESEEWVPFATILQRFGLREAMRRAFQQNLCAGFHLSSGHQLQPHAPATKVQRGTIKVRNDPRDLEEWQFKLEKEVSYTGQEAKP